MNIEMTKCDKCGSFYNKAKDPVCPYCGGKGNATGASNATVPVSGEGRTVAGTSVDRTIPTDEGRTVAVFKQQMGIDPVVGWLVCIDGKEKGRDYKIHADNNFIGRSEKMDICIRGDETISRDNHANICYDSRDKVFYFAPGDGRSIVRLNNKALLVPSEIKAYDTVEVGTTKLIFIPLCGASFSWDENKENTDN
ncbi:MAG: hypothetical protein LKF52_07250 [Butyrivibrio sp.]|nr:hypothetical protein [Butyrivibrio sp.]